MLHLSKGHAQTHPKSFEAVGFKTIGFEMNGPAALSYRHNLGSECYAVKLEVGFDFHRPTS